MFGYIQTQVRGVLTGPFNNLVIMCDVPWEIPKTTLVPKPFFSTSHVRGFCMGSLYSNSEMEGLSKNASSSGKEEEGGGV